jgi:hypothetical protein
MRLINTPTRLAVFILGLLALAAPPAQAQDARLQINHLDKFNSTATELIDVTVDQNLLQLAAKFLKPERSPDEAKIKELISNLKGVFVKRFAFDQPDGFTESDVEPIRSQLRAPGWSRIVGVRSRKNREINVDVYIMTEGSIIKGFAALVVEPRALTVVNIVGPIDLDKLTQLEGRFGIPKLDLIKGETPDDTTPEKKPM